MVKSPHKTICMFFNGNIWEGIIERNKNEMRERERERERERQRERERERERERGTATERAKKSSTMKKIII